MSAVWDYIVKGGIMMGPLFLTSILALAVVIDRAFFLRRKRIIHPDLVSLIQHIEKKEDVDLVENRLMNESGPFQNIVRIGLVYKERSKDEVKEAILDQGRLETRSMEKGLAILETAAGVSPLLGLLGTVLGMVRVFRVISEQGLGQTQSLSGGISEALITTVVGLFIAIPSLVAYNYFNNKVEDLILEIEKQSNLLLEKVHLVRSGRTK